MKSVKHNQWFNFLMVVEKSGMTVYINGKKGCNVTYAEGETPNMWVDDNKSAGVKQTLYGCTREEDPRGYIRNISIYSGKVSYDTWKKWSDAEVKKIPKSALQKLTDRGLIPVYANRGTMTVKSNNKVGEFALGLYYTLRAELQYSKRPSGYETILHHGETDVQKQPWLLMWTPLILRTHTCSGAVNGCSVQCDTDLDKLKIKPNQWFEYGLEVKKTGFYVYINNKLTCTYKWNPNDGAFDYGHRNLMIGDNWPPNGKVRNIAFWPGFVGRKDWLDWKAKKNGYK